MENIKRAVEELQQSFKAIRFPDDFSSDYELLECLSTDVGMETFLVQKKEDSALYVARCYSQNVYEASTEADILKRISHPQLPVYKAIW